MKSSLFVFCGHMIYKVNIEVCCHFTSIVLFCVVWPQFSVFDGSCHLAKYKYTNLNVFFFSLYIKMIPTSVVMGIHIILSNHFIFIGE